MTLSYVQLVELRSPCAAVYRMISTFAKDKVKTEKDPTQLYANICYWIGAIDHGLDVQTNIHEEQRTERPGNIRSHRD